MWCNITCMRLAGCWEVVRELCHKVLVWLTRNCLWLVLILTLYCLLQELVCRQCLVVRVLVAYEFDLGTRCCECIVVDEVVGLLIDCIVVSRSIACHLVFCFTLSWHRLTQRDVVLLVDVIDGECGLSNRLGWTFSDSLLGCCIPRQVCQPWHMHFSADVIAASRCKCLVDATSSGWPCYFRLNHHILVHSPNFVSRAALIVATFDWKVSRHHLLLLRLCTLRIIRLVA